MSSRLAGRSDRRLSRADLQAGGLRASHLDTPESFWTDAQLDASKAQTMARHRPGDPVWIFGHGSLIWNPLFPVVERRVTKVFGHHRAFCLASKFGRGSPDNPGLMLGLAPGGSCVGVALKMAGAEIDEELRLLWRREMIAGSYAPLWVRARGAGEMFSALTFVANRNASNYIDGRLDDDAAVARFLSAEGRIGTNLDYLLQTEMGLAASGIAASGIADRELVRLAQLCRRALLEKANASAAIPDANKA